MNYADPEFKHGDVVTYCNGLCMRGVVINIYVEADQYRYVLMEEPEGKPIAKHKRIDTHPKYIMQSRYFKPKPPTVFYFDKETKTLSR